MPPKSFTPSQLASGSSTPRNSDDHMDSTYSSPLFSVQLQDRLRQLDMNKHADQSKNAEGHVKQHNFNKNAFVHSIEVLSEDRRKTSELAREQALGNILRTFVMRYDPLALNHELFSSIVQSFLSSRTDVEASTALQSICVCTTMLDGSDDPRSGDSFELVNTMRTSLLKRISTASSLLLKQSIITCFAVLTYFMNAGGGGYGIETPVSMSLELAESISDPNEAGVAASALTGAALSTTLLTPGSAAEVANDWLYSLVPMLEFANIHARLAAVKFVAVLFESASPEALFTGENAEASEQIMETLESISQESIARTAKRDKKIQNLLVKSVIKSCRYEQQRLSNTENSNEANDLISDLVLQYHKHTLSKSLGITTWVASIVVEHLGWVFGPGSHIQLATNPYIKSLLKKEEVKVDNSISASDYDDSEQWRSHDESSRTVDNAKRSRDLRKMQSQKAEDRGSLD